MPAERTIGPRRAAVLGFPIAHSRSPQLHLAAYRALGLTDWTYDRIECTADQLPALVGGFGPEWVGLSVTMPGKFAALAFADDRTTRAELVGSANTLVHVEGRWRADNTDIDGVAGALATGWSAAGQGGAAALVLGAGGTAPAAIAGLAQVGVADVTVAARRPDMAERLVDLAERLGMAARHHPLDSPALADTAERVDILVSTVPADVAAQHAGEVAVVPVLLDAIYDPWPTPLAAAVSGAGGTVISGLQMLLHQAFAQVEQFTGVAAPRTQMADALA